MSTYKLNRDIGEYKKGTEFTYDKNVKINVGVLNGLFSNIDRDILLTWKELGWLDPVEKCQECYLCMPHKYKIENGCVLPICKNHEEGRWKPKDGEEAYYINIDGSICSSKCWNFYKNQIELGNCFPTRTQAEEAAKKMKELLISLHK